MSLLCCYTPSMGERHPSSSDDLLITQCQTRFSTGRKSVHCPCHCLGLQLGVGLLASSRSDGVLPTEYVPQEGIHLSKNLILGDVNGGRTLGRALQAATRIAMTRFGAKVRLILHLQVLAILRVKCKFSYILGLFYL
jgi:hypothetical protein